jgi:Rrf2 family protein
MARFGGGVESPCSGGTPARWRYRRGATVGGGPMNFTLSRRGDYALRAALHLAGAWDADGFIKIREISTAMGLPASYTPQILGLLVRAQLTTAKAGPAGGHRLARDPSTISVLDVVEAAEGDLVSTTCILRGGPCRWEGACAVHPTWAAASEAFRDRLRSTSLTDLVATDRELARAARSGPEGHGPTGGGRPRRLSRPGRG